MRYRVIVEQEDGIVAYSREVDADAPRATYQDGLTDVGFALSLCAPPLCPFDCDHCRE